MLLTGLLPLLAQAILSSILDYIIYQSKNWITHFTRGQYDKGNLAIKVSFPR